MITNKNGIWGELFANRYLRNHGYTIVETNYRVKIGEIDIIAYDKKSDTTVFVEVKALSNTERMMPREKVNLEKQTKILRTSHVYIGARKLSTHVRYDVIEVCLDGGDPPRALIINHFKGAF